MQPSVRYQVLTTRRMSTYGGRTKLRNVWTFCDRQRYDATRRTVAGAANARKLLIETGKRTLVVKG